MGEFVSPEFFGVAPLAETGKEGLPCSFSGGVLHSSFFFPFNKIQSLGMWLLRVTWTAHPLMIPYL